MKETLTPDEQRARDEWRAEILKSDFVQDAIRTAILNALNRSIIKPSGYQGKPGMRKPIQVTTNKRSYTVLPTDARDPLPKIEWLPGEKVIEIVTVETVTDTEK